MAWVATENFESYSAGSALNGASGGSNWNGNWASGGFFVSITAVSSPTISGTRCAEMFVNGTDNGSLSRAVTATTSGIMTFKLQRDTATAGAGIASLQATGGAAYVVLDGDGNWGGLGTGKIIVVNGVSKVSLGSWSANTTYTFVVDYDTTNNRYRVAIDGGAFSSYGAFSGVPSTGVTTLDFSETHGGSAVNRKFYIDSIDTSGGATYTPTLTETVTMLDSPNRSFSRALSESVTLTDTPTSVKAKTIILTESVTMTDPPVAITRAGASSWSQEATQTSIWTQEHSVP